MPRQIDASDESGLPPYVSATVITVGTFDGVHRGHRDVVERLVARSRHLEIPSVLVAMDSRIELYPAKVWDDYDGVIAGTPGWEARLDSWGVTVAVMAKRDKAMADRLEAIGWRSVYSDKDGSISLAPGR